MNAKIRRVLAWLPMAGVAALAVRTAVVWEQLPLIMWSHFDLNGNPNGRMPRESMMFVSFLVVVPMVVLFSAMSDRIGRRKPAGGLAVLAFSYVIDAFIITMFWNVITSNLERVPLRVVPIWIFIAALVPIVLAVSIDWRWWLSKSRREAARQLRSAQIVTVQRHGSRLWGALFALLSTGIVVLGFVVSLLGKADFGLIAMPLVAAVLATAAVSAWQGFTYRFTTQGVEVRALGIRLRSIPLSQIKDFSSERCNPLTDFGGWGIKGFGSDTAYIWGGHKVLHISTRRGDVYLGHQDPDRLVRDLEAIMKPAH